jgi:hypothetical protein
VGDVKNCFPTSIIDPMAVSIPQSKLIFKSEKPAFPPQVMLLSIPLFLALLSWRPGSITATGIKIPAMAGILIPVAKKEIYCDSLKNGLATG